MKPSFVLALFSICFPLSTSALWSQGMTATPIPAAQAPPPQSLIVNTGIAGETTTAGAHFIGFLVPEANQGNTDLNGDLDVSDKVMHVWDTKTGSLINTGMAAVSWQGWPQAQGRHVFFTAYEPDHGNMDLNGDGDAFDVVMFVYDVENTSLTNLGLAITSFHTNGERVAFLVSEANQGVDLNGDGDTSDRVLHVHDAQYGLTRNLFAACNSVGHYILAGNVVAFLVDEQDQGGIDLNGDADTWDAVLAIHLLAANITYGTGVSAHTPSPPFANDGSVVAILVRESAQSADLNGDADFFDEVLHVVDPPTGLLTNVGIAGAEPIAEGGLVAFRADEGSQGTNFNGDGDLNDSVYHIYRPTPPLLINLGHAALQYSMDLDEGLFAFLVRETGDGYTDYNGDLDTDDNVLFLYHAVAGTTTNLGIACAQYPEVEAGHVLVTVSESKQGDTDLNGDGDASDGVLHTCRAVPPTVNNLGLGTGPAGFQFAVDGSLIAFRVIENAHGATDLNGDGDTTDHVLHLHNLATTHTWNTRRESDEPVVRGGLIGFEVREPLQGGVDLNGDGDAVDGVPHVIGR